MTEILHSINRRRPVPTVRAERMQEFQEQFKSRGRPAKIAGVAADWPAIRRWSPDFFRDRFGDREVTLDGRQYSLSEFLDPLLDNIALHDAELGPGDAIFIPSGWWHAVINPELSIAVTLNLADHTNWKEFSADWVSRQDFGPVKKELAARILQVCGWLREVREG